MKLEDELVSYDLALRLKEIGFPQDPMEYAIDEFGLEEGYSLPKQITNRHIRRPHLFTVQRWLIEKKCMQLWIEPLMISSSGGWSYHILSMKHGQTILNIEQQASATNLSYLEALIEGIYYSINKIASMKEFYE